MRYLIVVILLLANPVFADEKCECKRTDTDKICKAYFELKDLGIEGMDVKLVCKERRDDVKK